MNINDIKLIPSVSDIKAVSDTVFKTKSFILKDSHLSKEAKDDFMSFINSLYLSVGETRDIVFTTDSSLEKEEYIIKIGDTIEITASSVSGELYALQTIKQLMFQSGGALPCIEINDKPKKEIRGFMLDVGRYFFTLADVKLIIRRMALHKLNLFHLHLTEDQGWRIEIDKYPLLTEKGSKRSKTNFNLTSHCGYYTKDDIREIVRYAHSFAISVMPEFDIPGHSRAALACYSYLGCFNRKLKVADHWGVKHDVLCAGKDSTYEFVFDIIDEMCELFPDKYFHIGGDEVPKHRWQLCPDCQAKIRELGLMDEDELQCYFMNRVNSYLKDKSKQSFMWSWDLKDASILESDLGFTKCGEIQTNDRPFIDTSTSAYYIDLPYGYISLKDSANHRIYDGNCLGVEATLWSEYVPDIKKADKMTYPRLSAICESAWCGECIYDKLSSKLDFYYSYLDKNKIGFTKIKSANPNKLLGYFQGLLFERRQLTWQGLTNIFDDKKVERLAKKRK